VPVSVLNLSNSDALGLGPPHTCSVLSGVPWCLGWNVQPAGRRNHRGFLHARHRQGHHDRKNIRYRGITDLGMHCVLRYLAMSVVVGRRLPARLAVGSPYLRYIQGRRRHHAPDDSSDSLV